MRYLIIFILSCAMAFGWYSNLDSALLNGSKKVDLTIFGDFMRTAQNNYTNNLYGATKQTGNMGYLNAQAGLGYTTGFYYNFRFAISFRATQSLYNPNLNARKDFISNATNLFSADSSIALGQTFLEYFDGDTAIKIGRFQPINEWISYLIDGISVQNGSFENLVLEGLWAYNYGRVSYYEITEFKPLNNYFNVGAKYFFANHSLDLKDSNYINVFSTFIPSVFTTIGARVHLAKRFSNVFWLGLDAGFTGSIENHQSVKSYDNNTFLFDSKILVGFRSIDFMLGYVMSGDAGMGSINILGAGSGTQIDMNKAFYKNVQPFFIWSGRAIKLGNNVHLAYVAGKANLFNSRLNAYVAYGVSFFNGSRFYGGGGRNLYESELDAMLEFNITNTLSAITQMSTTLFNKGVPSSFELNVGLRFMF